MLVYEFISALRIWTNVFPVRKVTFQGAGNRLKSCGQCNAPMEVLSHVLGQCTTVKGVRNHRHHSLCDAFAQKAARVDSSVRILKETTFTAANRARYRPGLVLWLVRKLWLLTGWLDMNQA